MASPGPVELYQAAFSGIGWEELLQESSVRRSLDRAVNLPGRRSALHMACIRGSSELVDRLLQIGANPNLTDKLGDSALHKAAMGGHPECLRSLITHGGKADLQNYKGETALHKAVLVGHKECTEVLLQNGACVDCMTSLGDTPLHLAAQGQNLDCLRELLNHKASVNQRNSYGLTAMDVAVQNNLPPLILMLNIYGAKTRDALASQRTTVPVKSRVPVPGPIVPTSSKDRPLDKSSWPSLPGQEEVRKVIPVTRVPDTPDTKQQQPPAVGYRKNLKVEAEDEHSVNNTAFNDAFHSVRLTPKPSTDSSQDMDEMDLGSNTVLELGSGNAHLHIDTKSIEFGPCSDNDTRGNTTNTVPAIDVLKELVSLEEEHPVLHSGKEVHETEDTTANDKPGKLTLFSWGDIKVQFTAPRLSQEVVIEYNIQEKCLAHWNVVSAIYSLKPENIQSRLPLLLSFPIQSSDKGLELLCHNRENKDENWVSGRKQESVKLAWILKDGRCHVYLWQLGALCVGKPQEGMEKPKEVEAQKVPTNTGQQDTEKNITLVKPSEPVGLTRQQQNEDIFSAALKTLMGNMASVEQPEIKAEDLNSSMENAGTEDHIDDTIMESLTSTEPPLTKDEGKEGSSESRSSESQTKEGQMEENIQSHNDTLPSPVKREISLRSSDAASHKENDTDDNNVGILQAKASDQSKQISDHFLLYLCSPKEGDTSSVSEHVKVAEQETIYPDLEFLQYVKHTGGKGLPSHPVVRRSLQKLGVDATDDVDTWTLLRLWLVSHCQLSSQETWKPVAQSLQELDIDIAEEFILSYEVFYLQKANVQRTLDEDQVQTLCQNLYAANCLPDKLKKQLKLQEKAKKIEFLLEKHVLKGDPNAKTMADFKKALYRTCPELVQLFSLL